MSIFAKRHYEWLAHFLYLEHVYTASYDRSFIMRLSQELKEDNPKFDADKFLQRVINGGKQR